MCIIKEAAGRHGGGRVHTDRIGGRIQPTCEILVRPASDRLTEKYAFGEVVDPPAALPCPDGRRLRSPLPQEMEIPAARIEAISAFFAHSGPQPLSLGPAPFRDRSQRERVTPSLFCS